MNPQNPWTIRPVENSDAITIARHHRTCRVRDCADAAGRHSGLYRVDGGAAVRYHRNWHIPAATGSRHRIDAIGRPRLRHPTGQGMSIGGPPPVDPQESAKCRSANWMAGMK